MPRPDPLAIVQALLESGDFGAFIGMQESDHFEAKSAAPYDLNTPLGRYELAKDTSAFANASGGHIVIGLTSHKLDTESTEQVESLDLLREHVFPVSQFQGVIKTHIWPPIKGLKIGWLPQKSSTSTGLGYIRVPPQHQDHRPFLISRVVEDGATLKENVFGIARRIRSDNVPLTAQELYSQIRDGRSTVAQRLTRIEDKLDKLLPSERARHGKGAAAQLQARLAQISKSGK